MAASTAPEAKRRILALLAARAALVDVRRSWVGPTDEAQMSHEMIHFSGPVRRTPSWRVLGGQQLDESYTVTLEVVATGDATQEQQMEERCWALINEIEQAVRADHTLGGLLINAIEFGDQNVRTDPLPVGAIARGTVDLTCTARI